MSLYQPGICSQEAIKISSTIAGDGFTIYVIKVTVSPYTWSCQHRYSEFRELHEKLVNQYGIEKSLLPPKKIFGNQTDSFILKRQAELELYLQTLLQKIPKIPVPLAQFLEFQNYEIRYIVENLAEMLYFQGDEILMFQNNFILSPLQLYALSERLQLPEPTCGSGNKNCDLGHALDFISQLKNLTIKGNDESYGTSNIIPNKLAFNLSSFKSLEKLVILDCKLKDHLKDLSPIRKSLKILKAHNSVEDLSNLLLADLVHWSPCDSSIYWPWWQKVTELDLSHNNVANIDPCIRLMSALESLDLSYNAITVIENIESLPYLSRLNLSNNRIYQLEALHTRLGNIRKLVLANNHIKTLQGFSRLYSLVSLDLSNNQVENLMELSHIGSLPCLDTLTLVSNAITSVMDYRPQSLLAFGVRASEITLDGRKVDQKEIDTVAVLQALQAAKEGRILRHSLHSETWNRTRPEPGIQFSGASSNAGSVIIPKENGCSEWSLEKCPVQPDPYTEEFRQQVAVLRKLGGSQWLRLYNQLQKENKEALSKQTSAESESSSNHNEWDDLNKELDIGSACKVRDGKCFFSGLGSSGNILLPDWLYTIGLSNTSFRSQIAKKRAPLPKNSSLSFEQSHFNCVSSPLFCYWTLVIYSQNSQCQRFPGCLVLSTNSIELFKLDNFNCTLRQSTQVTSYQLPTPCVSFISEININSIKYLALGPFSSYLEIHWNDLEKGLQKLIALTTDDQRRHLVDKLLSLNNLKSGKKYLDEELNELVRHAILMQPNGSLGPKGSKHLNIILCELVCRVQMEDVVGVRARSKPANTINFLIVTTKALLLVEESVILPPVGLKGPFKIVAALDIASQVHNIQMKDGGRNNHVCCCHGEEQKQQGSNECCFVHEIYSCGYWLLLDFEGSFSLKVRFFCREARSRFLETFLACRNHKA